MKFFVLNRGPLELIAHPPGFIDMDIALVDYSSLESGGHGTQEIADI